MQTDLYVSVLPASYQEAKTNCERQGGRLAMPRDADENNALTTLLTKGGVVDRMWLGGHDLGHEGSWVRPDGFGATDQRVVPMTWNSWAPGQPDGYDNENCIEMWTSGKWNDAPCKHEKAFVCSVPEPPQTLRFPCSADPSRQCTYDVFGADGKRASTLKQEFHGCQALCQAAHGQVAETRTAEQRSYLAQVLRQSGDVAMWLGLRPIAPTTWGPGTQGWTWMVSGANISKADERLFGPSADWLGADATCHCNWRFVC